MPRDALRTDPFNSNHSTDRLLTLLEFLAEQTRPLRLVDIARQCGMNISTVSRFLAALQLRGYVFQEPDTGRYGLSFKICRLGRNVSSHADLCGICLPYMRQLGHQFGEAVSLLVEHEESVVCLDTVADSGPMLVSVRRSGNVTPMHCSDGGKLFLCDYTPARLEQYVAGRGLGWYTPHTITTLERLRRELLQVRMQGYAADQEEYELGVRGVAGPIKDYTNKVVAAIEVNAPAVRMTPEHLYELLPLLLESCGKISRRLGWEPEMDPKPAWRR